MTDAKCTAKRLSPSTAFREDYRKHGVISYLEAADYMGASVKTVRNNVYTGRIPVVRKQGAYRISLLELDKVLRRGCL